MIEDDEIFWRKTVQVRHICIFDLPSNNSSPGRGDIEMGLLSHSDAIREDIITLQRNAEVDWDADPPEIRGQGEWRRNDYVYGPSNPREEYAFNLRVIETLKETIRFLEKNMPQLKEKITGYPNSSRSATE